MTLLIRLRGIVTLKILRLVPNALSSYRLAASPALLYLCLTDQRHLFLWGLSVSLLTDILDGLIARRFHLETALGALLDSVADMATYIVAIAALVRFKKQVFVDHPLATSLVLACYFGELLLALWRYGRLSSFHTLLAKATAYVQGLFILGLLGFGFHPAFFYFTAGLSVVSLVEEMVLVMLLPRWECNVRGLYWVLARRR